MSETTRAPKHAAHLAKTDDLVSQEAYREQPAAYTRLRRRRRKRGHGCLIPLLAVLLVVLAVAGACGYKLYTSARQVHAQGTWMLTQVDPMREALETGDSEQLLSISRELTQTSAWINAETHTTLWNLAAFLPVFGEDIRTAQTLGGLAESLTRDALTPVSESIAGLRLDDLVQDGQVDVALLQRIAAPVSEALPLIRDAAATIEALPDAHIQKVQNILDKLREPFDEYGSLLGLADQALALLPRMLGADGQARTYLVLALSNAELRSAGGFPGAWGILTVTDGRFELGGFTADIVHADGISAELHEDEGVYNFGIGSGASAVTAMPNFNRTGEIAAGYWEQWSGQHVDGVIALDPVALQYLISLTGELDTEDGTHIDGSNAGYEILHNVYVRYGNDNASHDAFFSDVAGRAASAFFANLGNADTDALVELVERLGEERRLQMWMADADEEALVSALGFGGEYAHDPLEPVLGIYLNDQTYSKIDWYAAVDVQVSEPQTNADGTQTYTVTATLTNTITWDDVESVPTYVTGGNGAKRDVTDMITTLYFSMPQDAALESFEASPEASYWDGWPEGIQVVKTITQDLAGESTVFRMRVTVPAGAAPLVVHVTPLAQEGNLTISYAGR
ncbi:DUF4012 domain-containing protein [Coriobacteriales bacterium OH1046]|nr:DUF4012 domain-containing protein [Coriobacteriales bacterium OH1046]